MPAAAGEVQEKKKALGESPDPPPVQFPAPPEARLAVNGSAITKDLRGGLEAQNTAELRTANSFIGGSQSI